jgi:hypothetical protein
MLKYDKLFQGLRCAKSHCFKKNEDGLQKINLPLCNLNLTHLTCVILLLIKKELGYLHMTLNLWLAN